MTTGAGNDLERSTELARKMVCEWGMSDAMGPLTFGKKEEQIFLGREIAQHQDYSEDTAIRIDHEIKRFVTMNYERAKEMLETAPSGARSDRRAAARHAKCSTPTRSAASSRASRSRSQAAARRGRANEDAARSQPRNARPIVPPLPPLNKPLTAGITARPTITIDRSAGRQGGY